MLKCPVCKQLKEKTEFYKTKSRKPHGLSWACRTCHVDIWREKTYKINKAKYLEMAAAQNNRCAICKSSATGNKSNSDVFAVDHNHKTGAVRGLLCIKCNTGIAMFNENIEHLIEAIEYIRKFDISNKI
jgi:hypothetical protein